jgi:hypothetical protein
VAPEGTSRAYVVDDFITRFDVTHGVLAPVDGVGAPSFQPCHALWINQTYGVTACGEVLSSSDVPAADLLHRESLGPAPFHIADVAFDPSFPRFVAIEADAHTHVNNAIRVYAGDSFEFVDDVTPPTPIAPTSVPRRVFVDATGAHIVVVTAERTDFDHSPLVAPSVAVVDAPAKRSSSAPFQVARSTLTTSRLPFDVVDATRAGNTFAIASSTPRQLALLDPTSSQLTTISLPKAPTAVTASSDGLLVAVGQDGAVDVFDTTNGALVREIPVPVSVGDVAIVGDMVLVSGAASQSDLLAARISTGAVFTVLALVGPMHTAVSPSGDRVYGAVSAQSPQEMYRVNVAPDVLTFGGSLRFDNCSHVFAYANGEHLLTGCGAVLFASDDATDMNVALTLTGVAHIQHFDDRGGAHIAAVVTRASIQPGESVEAVALFSTSPSAAAPDFVTLPAQDLNGTPTSVTPRFAWLASDGAHVFALAHPTSDVEDCCSDAPQGSAWFLVEVSAP